MGMMNSTMTPPTAGDVQSGVHQRMVALETMAMRSAPSLDSAVIGQNIGKAVGDLVKSHATKRSRSPDGPLKHQWPRLLTSKALTTTTRCSVGP